MSRRRRGSQRGKPRRSAASRHSPRKGPARPFPRDPRARFRLSRDLRSEHLAEEIELLRRLSDAVTELVGPDAAPAERVAAADRLREDDPEIDALTARLAELIRTNPKSVARGLMELGLKEAEEEEL